MNKITIIKGINKETGKHEIQRVVIFKDNAPVDFQEYERDRHLLLVANFLNDHDIDILDDGLRTAMDEGLISIVNFEDEIAMEAFRKDVVEANLLAAKNEVKEEAEEIEEIEDEKEEDKPQKKLRLSEEFEDLARYFRLANFRDNGVLNPAAKEELDEIVARNERAAAIEETRNQMLNDNAKKADYDKEYAFQRAALAEAIKNANMVEEEEKAPVKKLTLSPEFSDLARYFRLSILRNNGQLPPAGLKELEEIVARNERAEAIEETRNQMLAGNRVTEKGYQQVYDVHRRALAEEIKRVAALNNAKETVAEAKEDEKVVEPVRFDNNKDAFDLDDNSFDNGFNTEDFNNFDDNKAIDVKDHSNFVSFNDDENDNKTDDFKLPEEDKAEEIKDEEKVEDTENKGFVIVDDDKQEEEGKDEEDKVEGKQLPPIIIPAQKKEEVTPEDEEKEDDKKEPVNGIIVHPNPPKGSEKVKGIIPDGEDDPENTEDFVKTEDGKEVKYKKRNRVLAGLLGFVLAIPIVGGIVAYFMDKANKDKQPVPQDTQDTTSTTTTTQDTTTQQENVTMNATLSYCNDMNVPQTTAAFLCRGDVQAFLEGFKDPDQRREVISALAFGFEMNALTTKDGNLRTAEDGESILKSFAYDFICAKAVVNNYTPEQMARAFGGADMTYEKLIQGYQGFFNMLQVYGIYGTEIPPFRYLTNGENKDCKAFTELFSSLAVVNAARKSGTLYSSQTDDFIVTVDRLYGRGSGLQFTNEGAASLGMSMVLAFTRGQANVAYGEALILQEDHGLSKKGLSLAPDEDGHWEIDGFNYNDLFTQANRRWGSEPDYNSRCWQYQQSLYNAVEEARKLAKGGSVESRIEFADKIDDYEELKPYAAMIVNGDISRDEMNELYLKITDKYPHLANDAATFMANQSAAKNAGNLVSLDEYAPKIDAFFGLGLRDDYAFEEVMAYYINKVRPEAQKVTFIGPDGKVITGKPQGPVGPSGPDKPQVPAPVVTTETHEEQVEYEDLTPEEQHEAQEQIEQMQQEEEQQHEQQLEQAQQTADEVTEALHEGEMTPEEAVQALEEVGIDVDPDYIPTMEQIAQDEADAAAQAQAEAEAANQREQEERRRREEEEAAEEQRRREEEEALINGQNPPAPDPEPIPEPAPEPDTPSNPDVDPEIDPDHQMDDEQPYTGNEQTVRDLQDLRAMALELGDFGMDEPGRSYTL